MCPEGGVVVVVVAVRVKAETLRLNMPMVYCHFLRAIYVCMYVLRTVHAYNFIMYHATPS